MHEKSIICVCDERFIEEFKNYNKIQYAKHLNNEILNNTLESNFTTLDIIISVFLIFQHKMYYNIIFYTGVSIFCVRCSMNKTIRS